MAAPNPRKRTYGRDSEAPLAPGTRPLIHGVHKETPSVCQCVHFKQTLKLLYIHISAPAATANCQSADVYIFKGHLRQSSPGGAGFPESTTPHVCARPPANAHTVTTYFILHIYIYIYIYIKKPTWSPLPFLSAGHVVPRLSRSPRAADHHTLRYRVGVRHKSLFLPLLSSAGFARKTL